MKVFGIGLSKTGISSLTAALSSIGYRVRQFPTSIEEIDACDAATDSPVALWFQTLACRYPDSKFIYTTRERDAWLQSCEKMWTRQQSHFERSPEIRRVHQSLYGTQYFSRETFSACYERHDRRVHSFFATRPKQLLCLDIEHTQKWHAVAAFLNVSAPNRLWPHENATHVIERLASHVLHITKDSNLVSELTGIRVHVVDEDHSDETAFDESLLLSDNGWELKQFFDCAFKRFGNWQNVARQCGLSEEIVRLVIGQSSNHTRTCACFRAK